MTYKTIWLALFTQKFVDWPQIEIAWELTAQFIALGYLVSPTINCISFIFLRLILFSGLTMFGFRMAYDWYINSKLEARKKSTRFRQKRTVLAHSFADYIYPEFAAHENLLQEFELARTIRSLQRGLVSSVNRGIYIAQLENYLAGSYEDHVAKREVLINRFNIRLTLS